MRSWRRRICWTAPAAVTGAVALGMLFAAGEAAHAGGDPACGPGAGPCTKGNGTPGCDDVECCNAVCDFDPFCCENEWDDLCAGEAADLCFNNDLCADALLITLGDTLYSTLGMTTDGIPVIDCGAFGDDQLHNDIWYDFDADFTGTLVLTTCEELGGSADFDTRLAAYEGCACPVINVNFLGCNDDDPDNACGAAAGGFHSTLEIPVVAGTCYKVRVGGFDSDELGSGVLRLAQGGAPPVCPGTGDCHEPNGTPGCDDSACCNAVCAVVPSCCNVAWDQACADAAFHMCGPPPVICEFVGNPSLTQSLDQTIVAGTGIACNVGFITTPNYFARSYDLAAIPETVGQSFTVHCVEVGIDRNSGSDIIATVSIYVDTDGGSPQGVGIDLELLGSADVLIRSNPDPAMIIANFDLLVPAVVEADSVMVVELLVPQHTDGGVWPGANSLGETAPTYIMAPDCSIDSYVTMADIGFPNVHWVQSVVGEAGGGPSCPWDLNGDTSVGILDLLSLLAAWGPNAGDPADFDGDGSVGILDLLALLTNWGPCP